MVAVVGIAGVDEGCGRHPGWWFTIVSVVSRWKALRFVGSRVASRCSTATVGGRRVNQLEMGVEGRGKGSVKMVEGREEAGSNNNISDRGWERENLGVDERTFA